MSEEFKISFWQRIKILAIVVPFYIKVKVMNPDKITTIAGFIKAGAAVLGVVGVSVSPQSTQIIIAAVGSIYALGELIHGWFTNKKVS